VKVAIPGRDRRVISRGARARAFSLFEVLIAIAVLVVLSGAVFAFLSDLMRQRERAMELARRLRAGVVLIERIEADAMTLIAGSGSLGAGVEGTNGRLRLLSRRVTPPFSEGLAKAPLGDLQSSEFVFDAERGELRAAQRDGFDETRRERRALARGLERVRFRYHDGSRWVGRFDSVEQGRLPAAIEVALWFGPAGAEDESPDRAGQRAPVGAPRGEGPDSAESAGRGIPPVAPGFLASATEPVAVSVPTRAPDRWRIIVIPDGPDVEAAGVGRELSGVDLEAEVGGGR